MAEPTELIIPLITTNGTAKQILIEDRLRAAEAIRLSMEILQAQAPNGRDFPLGGIIVAQAIHRARRKALTDIHDALMAEAEQITDMEENQ